MSPLPTRAEIQAAVTKFATASLANRRALLEDPKRLIKDLLGVSLGSLAVQTVDQADDDTLTVVVPYVLDPDELEPAELDAASGGSSGAAYFSIKFFGAGPAK